MTNCNTKGVIYKIENKVNGKVYIGQTIRCADRRILTHLISLRGKYHANIHLQNAYNKYGENNFTSEIIGSYDISILDEVETKLIQENKKQGISYNIEDGGNLRKIVSKETRKRLSLAGRQAYNNPVILAKRKRQWEKYKGEKHPNNKPVICVTDNKIFYSITKAGQHYGISMKAISQTLSGRNPYCRADGRRLEFSYYEEGKKYKPKNHVHEQAIKVICITTGEVFDSIAEASKKYSLYTTNISKVCKGNQKSTGKLPDGTKLKWAYYEDYKALN